MSLITTSNVPTMSSREIGVLTGKEHRNVMRDIRVMLTELHGEDGVLNFERSYVNSQNKTQTEFLLPKDLTITLVSGYNVKIRHKIITRWQELEGQAKRPAELSRVEILQMALESEKGRIKAVEERDIAIATKAHIGNKREATAMAKASAAVRQIERLKEKLGQNQNHATVIAVERATGEKFPKNAYVALRKWCKKYGVRAVDVADERYGTVKAWPAGAWLAVHDIDLNDLFGGGFHVTSNIHDKRGSA